MEMQVPLLERPVDTELMRSTRNRQFPARFQDYVPTSTTPTYMGHPFISQKQRSDVAKARASAAQPEPEPEPEPEPPVEEWSDPATSQITTEPNSFGVFRKYSSLSASSHNPKDTDPFSDIPSAQPGPHWGQGVNYPAGTL
jgi:hypothetical protein